ncbi:hypothetical protein YC2023_115575 [Brassica napus]
MGWTKTTLLYQPSESLIDELFSLYKHVSRLLIDLTNKRVAKMSGWIERSICPKLSNNESLEITKKFMSKQVRM